MRNIFTKYQTINERSFIMNGRVEQNQPAANEGHNNALYNGKEENQMLEAALTYAGYGWPVIPVHSVRDGRCSCHKGVECDSKGKHPRTENGIKDASTDEQQIREWWSRYPGANVGIATGKESGLVALDIDPPNGGDKSLRELEEQHGELPETVESITGGDGRHFFFKYPKGKTIRNKVGFRPGIDIRSDGGYIVAPPSIHACGGGYEWEVTGHPDEAELAEMPDWLVELIAEDAPNEKTASPVAGVIGEGTRNDTLASLGGTMRKRRMEKSEINAALQETNKNRCNPPLPEKEVEGIAESVSKYPPAPDNGQDQDYGEEEEEEKNRYKEIIEQLEEDIELFHDSNDKPYARIGSQVFNCQQNKFFRRLRGLLYRKQILLGGEALKTLRGILEDRACFDGPEYALQNRVTQHEDQIVYDLTDEKGRAVFISSNGWTIEENPPIFFYGYEHQKSQVEPTCGSGDIYKLLDFVPISNRDTQLLLLVYLVSCFIPTIPHPVPILYGPQGSGKSSLFGMLRQLVDPSTLKVMSFPSNTAELVQMLQHNWAAFFDNVSDLKQRQSDMLCRAVSGEGFTKRQLYTDDDDIIYTFQRCVGLNGINVAATQPDLLDRSLLLELDRIPPEKRRTVRELKSEFDEMRPDILGGIFDILSKAMALFAQVDLRAKPRMADFAEWGCAIAMALGESQDNFLRIYEENRQIQTNEALNSSPVATAISILMEGRDSWEGTPTTLLSELEEVAEQEKINTHVREWPKAPNALTRRINEVKTNLLDAEIVVDHRHGKKNIIEITRDMRQKNTGALPLQKAPPRNIKNANGKDDTDGNDGDNLTVEDERFASFITFN
jgi:hypothetical protein